MLKLLKPHVCPSLVKDQHAHFLRVQDRNDTKHFKKIEHRDWFLIEIGARVAFEGRRQIYRISMISTDMAAAEELTFHMWMKV